MRINQTSLSVSYTSFRGVSVNPKNITSSKKIANDSIEKINNLVDKGAKNRISELNAKMEEITAEMKIRWKIEQEKAWYKPTHFNRINKMEANKKLEVMQEYNQILSQAQDELQKSDEIKGQSLKNMQLDHKNQAKDLKLMKAGNDLSELRAMLSANNQGFVRIAGYNEEKNVLERYFISEILKEKSGQEANVPSNILFFGPTGNGKTTFAKAFATETGCPIVPIRAKSEGDFLKKLLKVAKDAEKNFQETQNRTIIFVDEIDRVTREDSKILDELKDFLTNCSKRYHCTVFAATNHPLEVALPKEGENAIFPFIVSMDPPSLENKADVLKYYLQERVGESTDFNKLAQALAAREIETGNQFNIAQIKEICFDGTDKKISIEDILKNIKKTMPTIDKDAQVKYQDEMQKLMQNQVVD